MPSPSISVPRGPTSMMVWNSRPAFSSRDKRPVRSSARSSGVRRGSSNGAIAPSWSRSRNAVPSGAVRVLRCGPGTSSPPRSTVQSLGHPALQCVRGSHVGLVVEHHRRPVRRPGRPRGPMGADELDPGTVHGVGQWLRWVRGGKRSRPGNRPDSRRRTGSRRSGCSARCRGVPAGSRTARSQPSGRASARRAVGTRNVRSVTSWPSTDASPAGSLPYAATYSSATGASGVRARAAARSSPASNGASVGPAAVNSCAVQPMTRGRSVPMPAARASSTFAGSASPST